MYKRQPIFSLFLLVVISEDGVINNTDDTTIIAITEIIMPIILLSIRNQKMKESKKVVILVVYPEVQPLYPHSMQILQPSTNTRLFLHVGQRRSSETSSCFGVSILISSS